MKVLYLLTNEFPYGNWEPYLETEINYYGNYDKVYIFSLQLRKKHAKTIRDLPDNCKAIPIYYSKKWVYLLYSIAALFDHNLYKELFWLIKKKKINISNIISLFVYVSRSHYEARKIRKKIKGEKIPDCNTIYSYRFEYQPYVALLLKKTSKNKPPIVCRAHGYDLYEDRRENNYIPFRRILLKEIDNVFPCSIQGAKYLIEKNPQYRDKIEVKYLGTNDFGLQKYKKSNTIKIVSCSTVTDVKRVDLIIEALNKIVDKSIQWEHFGDGPFLNTIKEKSKELPDNISCVFHGNISNKELMKIYKKESFDLFINTSKSEGLPVSIMEATSFGIPCIATNVGGTSEIVTNKNGILLQANPTPDDIAKSIISIIEMSPEEYSAARMEARKKWKRYFCAEKNYKSFSKTISAILPRGK